MLYFAYGSNLCLNRLKSRVPGAEFVSVATLPDHELRCHKRSSVDGSGKFSVIPSLGAAVTGALFTIPANEKAGLDRAEGLGHGYDERDVQVETDAGARSAYTYVASPHHVDDSLLPFTWYRDLASEGAASLGLPASHVDFLRGLECTIDPDDRREAAERRFLPAD